jgi:indole-3-glycerol phosphate synthase
MSAILDQITSRIWTDEKENFESFSPESFALVERTPPIDILRLMGTGFFFVAEVKKASPSKGRMAEHLNSLEMARIYEKAGVDAVSVITEKHFFLGSKEDLKTIKQNLGIPVLRKDFLIHPYQIYESYNLGADFILLIAACLDDENLERLYKEALRLGLHALCEVHTEEELFRVLKLDPKIVGINNRNLNTFEVDRETSFKLKKLIPETIKVISESGIHSPLHIRKLKDSGFSGVLVGEALLTSSSPLRKLQELMNA